MSKFRLTKDNRRVAAIMVTIIREAKPIRVGALCQDLNVTTDTISEMLQRRLSIHENLDLVELLLLHDRFLKNQTPKRPGRIASKYMKKQPPKSTVWRKPILTAFETNRSKH